LLYINGSWFQIIAILPQIHTYALLICQNSFYNLIFVDYSIHWDILNKE
jgi:hypothetical protein